jgi:hypothetical protein
MTGKIISVQSRGDRLAVIKQVNSRVFQVIRKTLKWENGFFGNHVSGGVSCNETVAFSLSAHWVEGAKVKKND